MEGEASKEPLVWESCLWGLLSATSLMIGASIGVTCLPRKSVRAMLMSFGGGALLFALSIELFGHALHRSEESGESLPLWTMFASAVLGGLLFAGLNKVLNEHGAAVRKASTWKSRFPRLRSLLGQTLASRLLLVQIFQELDRAEILQLVQNSMLKEQYQEGDVIVSSETRGAGLFFVISGKVRLELSEDAPESPRAKKPQVRRQGTLSLLGRGRRSPGDLEDCPSPKIFDIFKRSRTNGLGSEPLSPKRLPGDPEECASPKIFDIFKRSRTSGLVSEPLSPKRPSSGDVHTWELGPDKIFGDMSLLRGMHCGMIATAMRTTKVLRIPAHEVLRQVDRSPKVRSHVTLQALEPLREIMPLRAMTASDMHSLAAKCSVVTFQPGQLVFRGVVDETTPIISVVLGSISVENKPSGTYRVAHVNSLVCAEHFLGLGPESFVAKALEPTLALVIDSATLASYAVSDLVEPFETATSNADMTVVELSPDPGAQLAPPGTIKDCGKEKDVSCSSTAASMTEQARSEKACAKQEARDRQRERICFKTIGHELAWDADDKEEDSDDEDAGWLERLMPQSDPLVDEIAGLVTDADMEERAQREMTRQPSKWSVMSNAGGARDLEPGAEDGALDGTTGQDQGQDHGHGHGSGGSGGAHGAIMVWLGILIDAVPESLVIGILINKGAEGGDRSFRQSAATALPFVIGVFISNLPESMSSSGTMLAHGVGRAKIMLMWTGTTIVTAVGAAAGALAFPPGSSGDLTVESTISAVEGLAAGAMLTMIAQTMMPEAFEQGGDIVGLSTLAGFLCALSVKLMPLH